MIMQIKFDTDPDKNLEDIYLLIKTSVKIGHFKQEHIDAIVEQVTELSNRMKEGEFSGEQEG